MAGFFNKATILCAVLLSGLAAHAYAFMLPQCTGMGSCLGYDAVQGFVCNNPMGAVTRMGKANGVSVNVGLLSLGTKTVTVSGISGIQAGDICAVSWGQSQAITAGLVLAGCRASAAGQADIQFATPVALGISAGTISLNIAWIG